MQRTLFISVLTALAAAGSQWPNGGLLAWCALVPLFAEIQRAPVWRAIGGGLTFAAIYTVLVGAHSWWSVHDLVGTSWPVSIAVVTLITGGYGVLWSAPWFIGWLLLHRRLHVPWIPACVLCGFAMEWFRTTVSGGIPWCVLAQSQVQSLPVMQLVELGGLPVVSAALLLVNALGAQVVLTWRNRPVRRAYLLTACAVVFACYGWGWMRLATLRQDIADASVPTVRVALVQPDLDHSGEPRNTAHDIAVLRRLTRVGYAQGADVVVWPESHQGFWPMPQQHAVWKDLVEEGRALLLEVQETEPERRTSGETIYRSALWLEQEGGALQAQLYRKQNLVPLIERAVLGVDSRALTPAKRWTEPVSAGAPDQPPFQGKGYRVAALICYDALFSDAIQRVGNSAAEWTAVITNDEWYDEFWVAEQIHHATAVVAIQTRRPVVRVANTGVSGVFDATGARVPLDLWTWPDMVKWPENPDGPAEPDHFDDYANAIPLDHAGRQEQISVHQTGVGIVSVPLTGLTPLFGHRTPAWVFVPLFIWIGISRSSKFRLTRKQQPS